MPHRHQAATRTSLDGSRFIRAEMQEMQFLEFSNRLISADFMPHGFRYLWDPWIG